MRDYVNSAALQEYTTKLVAKLKTLFPGTPTAVATVAEMTDHNKTYVYVGTETGYTAGDWYYWDGSAWTSGGPFQATSIITDTTLAVAGEAADAKATGDAIAAAKAAVLNAMAPAYSTSATYAVGEYVNYNGAIYRCTTAISTAEAWTSGHWTSVALGSDLEDQVGALKTQIDKLIDLPTDNLLDVTDITDVYNSTFSTDTENNAITVTTASNGTYRCAQTADTFVPLNLVTGKSYRLHAKAEKLEGNPTIIVGVRGIEDNVNGMATSFRLSDGESGFLDFTVDQYMKRITLLITFDTSASASVKFSELWLKEYEVDSKVTDQILNSYKKRTLLSFNSVFNGLNSEGNIDSDNPRRVCTKNKIKVESVFCILPYTDIEISFYAFDKNGVPLGFYNGNTLSKVSVSFASTPIVMSSLPFFNEMDTIRIYCRKTGVSDFTDYQDCEKISIIMSGEWFEQKKWYTIGDSITYGTFSKPGGSTARNPEISYAKLCSKMLNYDLSNLGVPNLGFTVDATDSSFTDQSIIDVMTNHDFNDAELVTIALGTNDYGRNGALGSMSDTSSTVSVYGRIKYIIETLQTKCPKARIVFLTPIPRETSGSLATQFSKLSPNANGFTLNDVKNAIIESCDYYGIEYLNCTDNFSLNYSNYQTYQRDNLHPSVQGHMLMAKTLAPKLM